MTLRDELVDLMARVALRDRAAFEILYQRVGPKLFGICLRILKDRPQAEDALQEVFVKIWHSADRYTAAIASPEAWLNTIARNHAIDVLRARKPGAAGLDQAEELPALGPTPEDSAITASEGRRIDGCLDALPAPRAEAVRRAYVDGDSYGELAERFSVPLNTMRSWLRRSLIQLRECLGDG